MKFFRSAILLSLPMAAAAATPRADLYYGHFELHVDYAASPGDPDAGWRFSSSYDEDDDFSTSAGVVRMDPESVTFLASPVTQRAVPSPAGIFSRFGPSGTPIWVLPQNNTIGAPFLGIRTTMPAGTFQASVGGNHTPSPQGSISLKLISVTGTGPDAGGKFATWKTESAGTTVFSFDTTNGITAADVIDTIPVSSHTHYNWGFTKPGSYQVTVEGAGKLMPPSNVVTSARETFNFAVPFSSRAAAGASLRVVPDGTGARLVIADPSSDVAYTPDRVMLEATTAATAASAALAGAQWELNGSLSTLTAAIANGVGVPPEVASAGMDGSLYSDLRLEIIGAKVPGSFAFISGGTVLADGIGDVIPINPATPRDLTIAFTQTGLPRITAVLKGVKQGTPFVSAPLVLHFGAGLTASYSYADWQSSFERAAGLATGALGDMAADYDRDGLANGVEFAFCWHGLDPTDSDAGLMPLPVPTAEGYGSINFLRDTYKDPLNETGWQIRPSASTDLVTWNLRSSRVPGFPLGTAETGAEEGNAHGRVTLRQLRVIPAPPKSFFRFSITSP